jgi:hypothetical protein
LAAQRKTVRLWPTGLHPSAACYVIELRPRARSLEMLKMIPQMNTKGRNPQWPIFSRNTRRPQGGQQTASYNQSQLQQKYDHYCNLAQATNGGDAVTREQHWQHAEHFLRMMNGSAT